MSDYINGVSSAINYVNQARVAIFVIVGTGAVYLISKFYSKGHMFGQISPETRICLRKSSLWALLTLGVESIPSIILRQLGWDTVGPVYNNILFKNRYTALASIVTTLVLTAIAMTYRGTKKNKPAKYALWAASSLAIGTHLAPIALAPTDLLAVVSEYVVALTIPVTLGCSIAPNFMFLNAFAAASTVASLFIVNQFGVPWLIKQRHPTVAGMLPTSMLSTFLFSGTLALTAMVIVNANLFVWYVQKSIEDKKVKKNTLPSRKGGVPRPSSRPGYQKSTFKLDGSDEVANGMMLASFAVFTFLIVLYKTCRRVYRTVIPKDSD